MRKRANKTHEIIGLIRTLQQIKDTAISEIDICINNVKNMFLRLSLNIEENKLFFESMNPEVLTKFIKKQEVLIKEAHLLVGKAIDINTRN